MEFLSADKILIVDLAAGDISEEELPEDLVQEHIGGAAVCKYLYEAHAEAEPIVLGTGLLTGTLCPGAATGIISAKSPRTGQLAHAPITLKSAIELKYSGFDYVVIKGSSQSPVFLWLHDSVADIMDASDVWDLDTWQTTDAWRQNLGEDIIQTMVVGRAGISGSSLAQIILNYWASGDRFGFGALFAQKNLKGVAMRGMGLLEVADPEGFVDKSLELLENIKNGPLAGKYGAGEIGTALGDPEFNDWLEPLIHRHSACFNTPYATNSFVFLDEDPARKEDPRTPEPGLLVTDVQALMTLKKQGLQAEDACRIMKNCLKQGIDTAGAAELASQKGLATAGEIEQLLEKIASAAETAVEARQDIFSPWCPAQPVFGQFETGSDPEALKKWWKRRQAVAYIFGIHPLFSVMSAELSEDILLELANMGAELDLSPEDLQQAVDYLQA